MKVIKNKLNKIKDSLKIKRVGNKITINKQVDDKQRFVIIGLGIILVTSLFTYLIILNTGFFNPTYSKPFREWVTTPQGIAITVTYLLLLITN